MGKIHIKRNGTERIFDLAFIKYEDMVKVNTDVGGSTNIGELWQYRSCILGEGELQNLPDTLADKRFFIFKFSPFGGVELPGNFVTGYEPSIGDEEKGGRPLYFGARQKTGDEISSFFDKNAEFFGEIPPAGVLDPNDYTLIKYWFNNIGLSWYPMVVYTASNDGDVRANYPVNYNATALFETSAGGRFGATLGVCGGGVGLTQNIAVHSFGLFDRYNNGAGSPSGDNKPSGNQANYGKPFGPKFNNLQIIPYPANEIDYNAHMDSTGSWTITDDGQPKTIKDDIDSFFVCTSVDGVLYVGMAACRFSGRFVTDIQVTFLPAWFWGRSSLELDFDMDDIPDFNDTWFGPDVPSNPGGNGTWTITQSGAVSTVAPVETAFNWMTPDKSGVHLVMLNGRALVTLIERLWGYTDGKRAAAYSSIITAHQMPAQLLPPVRRDRFADWVALGNDPVYFGANSNTGLYDYGWAQWIDPDRRFDENAEAGYLVSFTSANNGPLAAYTDSYLDFNPHTNVEIFLPFAGSIRIPPEQCIGGRIDVAAHVYYLTGDICYYVKCTSNPVILKDQYDQPLTNIYTAMGNCAVDIPLIGINTGEKQKMSNALSGISGFVQIGAGIATENPFMIGSGVSSIIGAGVNNSDVGGGRVQAGGIGGNTAIIGNKQIILRITKPQKAYDDNWLRLNGSRSEKYVKLSDIAGSGFLKVEATNINKISTANAGEKTAILNKLREGVFI